MGFSDQDPEGPTLKRRRQTCDSIIEEIYGGPQSRENFVVRTGEINKLLGTDIQKQWVYRTRKKHGLKPSKWYSRIGHSVDDLRIMIPEITDRMGTYYRNRSGFYIDYFYQMAYDLGDTSLPLIDACKILYVAVERRKPRDGGGLGIHPIHPMYPVYRRNLTTSLTTTEGLRKNYDSLYSARIA